MSMEHQVAGAANIAHGFVVAVRDGCGPRNNYLMRLTMYSTIRGCLYLKKVEWLTMVNSYVCE